MILYGMSLELGWLLNVETCVATQLISNSLKAKSGKPYRLVLTANCLQLIRSYNHSVFFILIL